MKKTVYDFDEATVTIEPNEHSSKNARKTIKVSPEIKSALDSIQTINGYNYTYETIGKLIDFYLNHSDMDTKNKFKMIMDIQNNNK